MHRLLLFSLIIPSISLGSVADLLNEFMKNNSDISKTRTTVITSKLDTESIKAKKSWNFGLSSTYYNNQLDKYSAMSSDLKTSNLAASLSKDFGWGGSLSFDNGITKIANPSLYEFNQTISYSQDIGSNFFGMDFRKEIEVSEIQQQLTKVSGDQAIEQMIFNFYQTYVTASLNKTIVGLQKEALQRATRRLRTVRKKVRDGIREKVDLYQAESLEIASREGVKSAEINFIDYLNKLEKFIHRKISHNEIDLFSLKNATLEKVPRGEWLNNKNNLTLLRKIDLLNSSIARIDYSFIPTVTLSAKHKTNDYNQKSSSSFSDGSITSDQKETTIGIMAVWPIGSPSSRVAKAKSNIELKTTEMERNKLEKNFHQSKSSIIKQVDLLEKNYLSANARLLLAQKTLHEYNRLYRIGRADIDQVINAEENLVNTERVVIQHLAKRKLMVTSLALLYGNLETYLLSTVNPL